MTCDEGYRLAKHNLTGEVVCMGPEGAYLRRVKPLSYIELRKLPHPELWEEYDLNKLLGYIPSLWERGFGMAAPIFGYKMTIADWHFLKNANLIEAREWLGKIIEDDV